MLAYLTKQALPRAKIEQFTRLAPKVLSSEEAWQEMLYELAITDARHIRIVTEGALLGTVVDQGTAPDLAIISDGAGQFDILIHVLCWIHAERVVAKLLGFSEAQREALAAVRGELWSIYDALKAYKQAPDTTAAAHIEARFDTLCATQTLHGRPRYAKLSFDDFEKVKIAAIHPDFV
jgi:hypothetical protein